MLRQIDEFFLQKNEPHKGVLIFLRKFILDFDENITEAWKYKMPFYCFKGKMFCYLWISKKNGQPYIGFVDGNKMEHPLLIIEKRARMKIMMLDPREDVPVETIAELLSVAVGLTKNRYLDSA